MPSISPQYFTCSGTLGRVLDISIEHAKLQAQYPSHVSHYLVYMCISAHVSTYWLWVCEHLLRDVYDFDQLSSSVYYMYYWRENLEKLCKPIIKIILLCHSYSHTSPIMDLTTCRFYQGRNCVDFIFLYNLFFLPIQKFKKLVNDLSVWCARR